MMRDTGIALDSVMRRGRARVPRLGRALLKRELPGRFAIILLIATAASLMAAWYTGAASAATADTPAVRVQNVLLAIVAVLAVVRTAGRIEGDSASGWTAPLFTAGSSRASYALGLAGAVAGSSMVLYSAALGAYTAGTVLFGDTLELARVLPRTLLTSALLLGVLTVYSAALGLVLRNALGTVILLTIVLLMPYALVIRYVTAGLGLPSWLELVIRIVPPITPPDNAITMYSALAHLIAGMVFLVAVATRFAGRRT